MLVTMLQMILLPALLPIALSCFFFGFGSGGAMIPYTIIKEVNPDNVRKSATRAMNFMTFGISAVLGPAFRKLVGPDFLHPSNPPQHFQSSLWFWTGGIVIALVATLLLRETGQGHVDA